MKLQVQGFTSNHGSPGLSLVIKIWQGGLMKYVPIVQTQDSVDGLTFKQHFDLTEKFLIFKNFWTLTTWSPIWKMMLKAVVTTTFLTKYTSHQRYSQCWKRKHSKCHHFNSVPYPHHNHFCFFDASLFSQGQPGQILRSWLSWSVIGQDKMSMIHINTCQANHQGW